MNETNQLMRNPLPLWKIQGIVDENNTTPNFINQSTEV